MVETSTSTLEKSNWQVDRGVSPNATMISSMTVTCSDSSLSMIVISSMTTSDDDPEKPALA